jgi:hypothetical protein
MSTLPQATHPGPTAEPVSDELEALMIAVYAQMRRRRQWITAAADEMGLSYLTLDRLLVGVTRQPRPETVMILKAYAEGETKVTMNE